MRALKKFLMLTTALTMAIPCKSKADAVVVDSQETLTSSNSIYQDADGGIAIRTGADLDFSGGGIMDYSSYHSASGKTGTINIPLFSGSKSQTIESLLVGGDFTVDGGNLSGAIKLYKGHDITSVTICAETGTCSDYPVSSAGNFIISGGDFRFTQSGEILMKATAIGEFYLNNGNFYLSDHVFALIGSEKGSNNLYVRGGTYDIAAYAELALRGSTILFKHDSKYTPFKFTGDGKLSFAGETTVDSGINWDTGTLELKSGMMAVNANVTVNSFTFSKAGGKLTVKKGSSLTVKSDFKMQGASTLEGEGELRLTNGANATFIGLNFGSIVANGTGEDAKGELNFMGASTVGTIQINKGTLKVNANLSVTNLTLTNSVAEIQENLSVSNLNFDSGTIKYTKTGSSVTLNADSTITNDAAFDTTAVDNGNLVINASKLDFTDKDGVSKKLSNAKLSIRAEKDAVVNFNQKQGVALNGLELLQATANFNTGSSSFNSIILGNANDATKGALNIASGAVLTANDFTSYFGSAINVEGVLALNGGTVNGTESAASTFTGAGTLKIGGQMTFNGRFENFGTLQLDGGAVFDFGGLSNNAVGTVSFTGKTDAVMNITNGIFTAGSLVFDDNSKGSINIAQNGTLALDAKGNDVSSIIHGTGSIGGAGALLLVGNTSVNFGGNDKIKNLGTLKIEDGTATISGSIKIGAVEFVPNKKGTLNIESGKVLELQKIQTKDNNTVKGGGTLKLTGTEKSTFGGLVSALGTLEFANGGVEFSNGGVSKVGTITGNGGDLTVNNGTLEIGDALSMTGGKVSGSGTLRLTKGGSISTKKLNRLIVGGNTTFKEDSSVTDLQFSKAAEIDITSALTVGGAVTTVDGAIIKGGTLSVVGTGTFAANSVRTNVLSLSSGAKATFTGNNEVNRLDLAANSAVSINSGATLTLDDIGADGSSLFTGSGTLALKKSGMTVNSKLSDLGGLSVLQSATLSGTAQVGSITAANGATLTVDAAAQANIVSIASGAGLVQNADMTVGTVNFAENSGSTLTVNKTLNVTRNIAAASNTLNGTGTLILAGGANGAFATGVSFKDGRLIVGSGTASFTGNTTMGAIGFSGDGGRLNIESGNTLSLSSIATKASNTVTGAGTLRLSGSGSVFDAPISSLGEINIAGGGASFNKNATVGKLSFNGGTATVGSGAVLSSSDLAQSGGTLGTVSGDGELKIKGGKLSTGGKRIGAVYVGSGTVSVADNSAAGALRFESENGTLNVEAGKTMTVSNAVDISGNLTGDGTLKLENGGVFKKELQGFGTIATDAGTLTFNRNVAVSTIELGGGTAVFGQNATITDAFNLDAGNAVFHGSATQIGKLTMAGAGRATFKNNASITDGASIGGTLDIEDNMLTVENGNLTFADNSALNLRFSASATDDNGVLIQKGLGYGNIVLSSGSVSIGNNVSLNMTVDYGLHTAETGTEFQLLSGTVASGGFSFANSRYKLEKVDCADGDGLCYKLTQDSKAEEVVVDEKGSQNNQNTAAAILDGGLFNEGDKLFEVAKHLDALSQNSKTSRAYLNALTAVAPDVSGSTTAHAVAAQTQIAKAAFNRMNGLQKKMGNRSQKYRQMRELYGRSGGSGYERSLMRTQDYYRRAGYETNDTPASRPYPAYDVRTLRDYRPYEDEKPQRKVKKYRSQRQEDYGAFYGVRPTVGVWAQALYNSNEYKSDSKEDGFSGSTTGLALGVDATFADVFALGFGYAKTTSDLKTLQRSTDVSGNSFFVYGMYKPANWYLTGIANFGSNSFDETKDLSGLIVTDSYDTKTVGGQLMWGLDSTGWNPAVGVRYTAVSRAAHEDPVGQNIASFSNKVFSAVAEVRRDYELSRAGNGVWSSDLSAGLIYDFSRSADSATVALSNGSSYTVEGEDPDAFGAQVGAGIAYTLSGKADISAHYGLEVRPEWFSHTLTATLRVMF